MKVQADSVHVVKYTDKKGRIREYHYAWRGGPRIKAKPGTIEYFEELVTYKPTKTDTVGALIDKFKESDEFQSNSLKEIREQKSQLERIRTEFGKLKLKALAARGVKREIREWHYSMGKRARSADRHLSLLRRLFNFGIEYEYIDHNPTDKIKRLWSGSRKNEIWSENDFQLFTASNPPYINLAVMMGRYTGQRQKDLLKLKWSQYDGTHIYVKQGKGGQRVKVRVHADLKAALDRLERTAVTILTNSRGRPWQTGFGASFTKAKKRAKITGLTFHDLRGTFATEAKRSGLSNEDICKITGHTSRELNSVFERHYLADDQLEADNVIIAMERKKN